MLTLSAICQLPRRNVTFDELARLRREEFERGKMMETKENSPIVQILKDGLTSLWYGKRELFFSRDSSIYPPDKWIVQITNRGSYRATDDEAEAIKWLKGEE